MPAAVLSISRSASLRLRCIEPRAALVLLVAAVYLVLSFATRVALAASAIHSGQLAGSELPRVFATGLAYDAVTSLYLLLPRTIYLAVLPARMFNARAHRAVLYSALTCTLFGASYLGVVEYFFFDEFNARFNFVAVEYLIYPHEVFLNIWQSYPVGRAIAATVVLTLVTCAGLRRVLARIHTFPRNDVRFITYAAGVVLVLVCAHLGVNLDTWRTRSNRVADEIAANGIYSFVHAAVNSRLDYPEFYATVPEREAVVRVRRLVAQSNTAFIPGAANPLARRVTYPASPRLLNVVVLLQESLGAEFVGAYGDKRGLTPNIDALARESIVFTHALATGTRTVRGMEAVTASFPPVPAESIVKRPGNEHMFNWSTVMTRAGYSPTFIYGGYGTFDNMNYFFGNNGYRVTDRTDIASVRFSNIWGVSDEDLFEHALQVFDRQYAAGERIFSVVMSTSNHKPFTFPTGVAGVPEKGGGREAGVRYADHAIGRFIAALRTRPYFENTVVVIVADHGARVYGKADFPLDSYAIPFLVYAPAHFRPRTIATLTSQIDVAPTVLGLLRISHESAFFGRDVLASTPSRHAVPLNHNRDIALFDGERLSELGFRSRSFTTASATLDHELGCAPGDEEGRREAASVFQLAYSLYTSRRFAAR